MTPAFEVLSGLHGLSPQPAGSQALLGLVANAGTGVQSAGGGVRVGPRSVETPRLEACSVRPVARTTMSGHSIPKNAQSTCTWQVSDPLSSVILSVTFPATEETPTAYGVAGNELLDLHLGHCLCRSCRGQEETMGHGNLRGPEALGGEAASPGPSALWAEARGAPPAWAPLCPMARFPL